MVEAASTAASVALIRERKRTERLAQLRSNAEAVVSQCPGSSLWLFGSLARGDWDAYSDVDMLAVAGDQATADQLAEAALAMGMADDALALSTTDWLQQSQSQDPYWRAIAKDALCLAKG